MFCCLGAGNLYGIRCSRYANDSSNGADRAISGVSYDNQIVVFIPTEIIPGDLTTVHTRSEQEELTTHVVEVEPFFLVEEEVAFDNCEDPHFLLETLNKLEELAYSAAKVVAALED